MQPPHLLLFLFLPLLLPGMWADLEDTQVFQMLQTVLFTNVSSAEVSGVVLLGDVPIYALDPANWSIHFHWPWSRQAASEGDAEKIKSHLKIYLRNMVRYVHEVAQQEKLDYPLVIQIHAGCVLYPNRTSWGFLDIGEGGRDLIAFEVERQRWEPRQPSTLAEQVSKSINRKKAITALLEHLLSNSCQSHILTLCRYGRADLERQGETTLILAWPPQSLPNTGDKQCPTRAPPTPLLSHPRVARGHGLRPHAQTRAAPPGATYGFGAQRAGRGPWPCKGQLLPENHSAAPTVSITIAVLLLVATASAGGFWWWKRR
uniref:MHC class I-like antigen recognition-like domain-containing protein n=1 Tax=Calidris pygmaea TaxID=425635 RepID=A0A8C3J3F8_9CHAR